VWPRPPSSDVSEIKAAFRIPPERPTPNIAPSWNVAPTDPLPVVRYDAKDHQRSLEVMRWGLVAVLGQGHQDRLLDHQRASRGGRHQTLPIARRSSAGAGINRSELERLWRRLQPLATSEMRLAVPPPRDQPFRISTCVEPTADTMRTILWRHP
jgi:hypothetical protein